ncbi:MAG: alpha/beta fold hydrolase [Syntrophomonadaceae bacterium]
MGINEQARPFYIEGKHAAILFIHGFTASPSEVLPTARLIAEARGVAVRGILLPGHGASPEELNRFGWEDWFEAVKDACLSLLRDFESVYVAGLSMGGMLSLLAGVRIPNIKGIVSINAPIFVEDFFKVRLAARLKYWRSSWPKADIDYELKQQGRFAYDCYPLKALANMLKLRKIVMKELPAMKLPVLVFQSLQDETVLPHSARYIEEACRNSRVQRIDLSHSRHVATMGPEIDKIAENIIAFVNRWEKGARDDGYKATID